MNDKVSVTSWPTKKACFYGFCVPETCVACEKANAAYEIRAGGIRFKLCADCLHALHAKTGTVLENGKEMKQDNDNCRQTQPGAEPGE